MTLEKELMELLNRHSVENASNTPDFILVHFLMTCLVAWNQNTRQRDLWFAARLDDSQEKKNEVQKETSRN